MTIIGLCCVGFIIAQASQSGDRPLTLADISAVKAEIATFSTKIIEISSQMANVINIVTMMRIEDASDRQMIRQHAERLEQHGQHLSDQQRKLDRAGINGEKRVLDEDDLASIAQPTQAKPAQVALGGGILGALVIALGKAAWAFGAWAMQNLKLKP